MTLVNVTKLEMERRERDRLRAKSNGADPVAAIETSAYALQGREYAPLVEIVPGYVVEGLTLLAGNPKLGKSWLLLQWGLAVSLGGAAMGSVPCRKRDVLLCMHEDSERRLQGRIKQLMPGGVSWPAGLYLRHAETRLRRLNQGGIEDIDNWIGDHPNCGLVGLDTMATVRSSAANQKAVSYQADYDELAALHELALRRKVGIVGVTHLRKGDPSDDPIEAISGTFGQTAAADTLMVLRKNKDAEGGATLYGRGRDLEEFETALRFRPDGWAIEGDAATLREASTQDRVYDAVAGGVTKPAHIARELGISQEYARKALERLCDEGRIVRTGYGQYAVSRSGYGSAKSGWQPDRD